MPHNSSAAATPPSAPMNRWQTSWTQWRSQAEQRWQSLAPRERRGLSIAAAALAVLLIVLVGIRPAWRTLQESPTQLNQVETQLQRMKQLATEAQSLRTIPPISATQSAEGLKAATDRLGAVARLNMQGDRATLSLTGVSPEALTQWLREVRTVARARVGEAQLTRNATGYAGTIVLTVGGASP